MTAPPDDLDEDRVQELQEGLRELADRTTLFFGQRPFVADFAAKALATLTAENKALRIALRNLRNQVAGSFDAFESELRPVIGNTNYACVMEAIAKADAADSGCLAAGAANER